MTLRCKRVATSMVASGGEGLLRRLIVMGLDESALLAAARLALVLDAGASQQEGE